jgi:hypothetical protein
MVIYTFIYNNNYGDRLTESLLSINKTEDTYVTLANNNPDAYNLSISQNFSEKIDNTINSVAESSKSILINQAISSVDIKPNDLIFVLDGDIKLLSYQFFNSLYEISQKILKELSCIICYHKNYYKVNINYKWQRYKGYTCYIPMDGYGLGVAGGAIATYYKNWAKINGYRENIDNPYECDSFLMYDLYRDGLNPVCLVRDLCVFQPVNNEKMYVPK